ncbi:hypothetical protein [Streptomyces sp. NPDC054887]
MMTYDAGTNTGNPQQPPGPPQPPPAVPGQGAGRRSGPGPLTAPGTADGSAGPSGTGHTGTAAVPTGGSATGPESAVGSATGLERPAGAAGSHGADGHGRSAEAPLIPHGERDKLALRLQQAVNTFVDGPRRAVEEADGVFEEAARLLTDAVAERRGSLRSAWSGKDHEAETEELRVALRTYREATERLLRM